METIYFIKERPEVRESAKNAEDAVVKFAYKLKPGETLCRMLEQQDERTCLCKDWTQHVAVSIDRFVVSATLGTLSAPKADFFIYDTLLRKFYRAPYPNTSEHVTRLRK